MNLTVGIMSVWLGLCMYRFIQSSFNQHLVPFGVMLEFAAVNNMCHPNHMFHKLKLCPAWLDVAFRSQGRHIYNITICKKAGKAVPIGLPVKLWYTPRVYSTVPSTQQLTCDCFCWQPMVMPPKPWWRMWNDVEWKLCEATNESWDSQEKCLSKKQTSYSVEEFLHRWFHSNKITAAGRARKTRQGGCCDWQKDKRCMADTTENISFRCFLWCWKCSFYFIGLHAVTVLMDKLNCSSSVQSVLIFISGLIPSNITFFPLMFNYVGWQCHWTFSKNSQCWEYVVVCTVTSFWVVFACSVCVCVGGFSLCTLFFPLNQTHASYS